MTSPYSLSFRPDVQGLRAIAVALVVLAHAKIPGFAGGFVGVDVFFVLSGYLITGLLVRERVSSGTIRYGQFLARRLRRLLPAMLAMLAIVLIAASLLLSAYEVRMQTGSAVFAASWTSNFFSAFSEFDYFSALTARDLFLHTWSLGVEEQFYLVWPWLILLAFAAKLAGAQSPNMQSSLLVLLAVTFATSLALCIYWAGSDPVLGFYMMPARGWQFALGSIVYVAAYDFGQRNSSGQAVAKSASFAAFIAGFGLILIFGSAFALHEDLTYPGLYAMVPSLGAAMVIAAGHGSAKTIVGKTLASRYFVWVGDRSYSIYLWHWPVLVLGSAYGLTQSRLGLGCLVLVSVALAAVTYRFIELPFWKGRFSNTAPRQAVLVSAFSITLMVGFTHFLTLSVHGRPEVAGQYRAGYEARSDLPAIYQEGLICDTWYSSAELTPCETGNLEADRTAVLFGDSIGAQWVEMFFRIYAQPDWRVIVLTKSSCAVADEEYYYDRVGGTYDVCTAWRESAMQFLEELGPSIIFVGSSSTYDFSASQWRDGTSRILERLSASAEQVVLIPGTPALTFDGPACLESPYRFSFRLHDSRRECEQALVDETSTVVAGYLVDAAERFDNAHVLNLNDLVCPQRRCAAQRTDGVVVFRDRQHLTNSFVLAQVAEVQRRLDELQLMASMLEPAAEFAPVER
jgi:peptidoglycan/LPS O-acetylase OafA/YrhL